MGVKKWRESLLRKKDLLWKGSNPSKNNNPSKKNIPWKTSDSRRKSAPWKISISGKLSAPWKKSIPGKISDSPKKSTPWKKSAPWKKSTPWKKGILWKLSTLWKKAAPWEKNNPSKQTAPGNRILPAMSLLCLALAAVLCAYPTVRAAGQVDMQEKGQLTLAVDDSAQIGQDMALIKGADGSPDGELAVHAWKLADMLETGNYRPTAPFADLPLEENGWSAIPGSQEGWKELSAAALAAVYELDEDGKPVGEPKTAADYDGKIHVTEDGTIQEAAFSGMDLGLYLIVVDAAQSPRYEYTFTPLIVSLPWSEYQYVGGDAPDTWQYQREAALKPAREPRYGSVRIRKTLTSYNATQGDVTFVFEIVARESDAEDAKIVYSNVVSLTFSGTGTQEALLEHIPAGAVVTVTEVYSGANCQITLSDDQSKTVTADGEDASPITFSFENEYDEDAKSGYGIENRFRYDTESNTYQWSTDRPEIGASVADGNKTDTER